MSEQNQVPITLRFGEERRWHPVHCYLYYTDIGELTARFTLEELRERDRADQSVDSNTNVSAEM